MPTTIGSLLWVSGIDNTGLRKDANEASRLVGGIGTSANSVASQLKSMAGALGIVAGGAGLVSLGRQVIEVRGQFQQLGIAFEVMLNSKEKADKLMSDAVTFAQKTPFTLTDVATNVKQLMAMGIETENVMATMKSLGDVAAGVSVPISRIAINYGQVAVMGKLQSRELRDFAMAGIPLVDEMAKNLGKSKTEIQDMVSAGQVGFPIVEAAFKSMAGEGGKFYNLMEKQNASVTGQVSNLTDKFQVMLNEIGKSNEGIIYGGISGLADLISNYETVLDVLKGLVVVYGTYKVALMIARYEQKLQVAANLLVVESNGFLVASEARVIAAKMRSAEAQKALNASMLANPYVLAAAAIAAVGFAIYKLSTYQTDLEKALERTSIEIENETDKALDLFSALKATKQGTEAWEKARQKIISQYGDLLPKQISELDNLEKQKTALDLVTKSLSANIAERVRLETVTNISSEYNPEIIDSQKDIVSSVKDNIGAKRAADVKYQIAALVAAYKAEIPGAEQELSNYVFNLSDEIIKDNPYFNGDIKASAINLVNNLKAAKTETNLANEAFIKYGKTIKKDGDPKKEEDLITATQERVKLQKQLIEEERILAELQNKKSKTPLKDIADQELIIKGIKEQLGLKKKDETEAAKLAQDKLDYETEIGRKRIAAQLEIEQSLLSSQEDSDEKLRAQADLNYRKSLNEIATQKAEQLKKYQELYGKKETLPQSDQDIIDSKIVAAEKIKNDTTTKINKDAAEKLKDIWKNVNESRLSNIEKEKQAVRDRYVDELKFAIKTKDTKLQDAINKNINNADAEIDRKYKLEELDFQQEIEFRKNEIAENGYNRENELAKKNFETFKKYQQQKINILKATGNADDAKKAELLQTALDLSGIDEAERKTQELANNFFDAANYATQLASALGNSNSSLAELLTGVSKVANTVGDLVSKGAFSKDGMSDKDAIGSIISGATQLIGLVVGQAAKNKQEMKEYYDSIIAQQHQYNLSLNEQLRLNEEINGSVFFDDFAKTLSDSSKALKNANEERDKAMAKFWGSEAIVGKKNVVSGGNVLSGIGAGAALGAGIGSIVPVVGTVIGAAVGALVGAFAGLFAKKKKDIVKPLLDVYPDLIQANGKFNVELAKTLIANKRVTEETKKILQNVIDWEEAAKKARDQITAIISDMAGNIGNDLRDALVDAFENGTNSAAKFGESVKAILEDLVSQQIFNALFGPLLKKLEDDMKLSYGVDPVTGDAVQGAAVDNDWIDDILRFYAEVPKLTEQFNATMSAVKVPGFDLFNGSSSANNTATNQITRALTEDTGSALMGLWRRSVDEQKKASNILSQSNGYLFAIAANTLRTADNTEELKRATTELIGINDNTKKSYLNDMGL